MRKDAKSVCIHGHDKPPGKDCPECARVRQCAYQAANRERLRLAASVRGKLATKRAQEERAANPITLCSKGLHERKAGIACQECRRDHWRKYNAANDCGHARTDTAKPCRQCANECTKEWRAKNLHKTRADALANYYKRRAEGLVPISTPHVVAWKKKNPEAAKELARKHDILRRARKAGALGSHTPAEFRAICARQKHRCTACLELCDGLEGREKLTEDHIVPYEFGGSNYAWNLQGLCGPCNSSKGAKIPPGTQIGVFDVVRQ